jgi:uroporphyrinogen-III synthase
MLGTDGFAVRRAVLYEAVAAARLSDATAALLRDGRIELALFFSPRTAASFVRLLHAAGLSGASNGMTAVTLSSAVAATLDGLGWRDVRVAAARTEAAMLDAVDRAIAERTDLAAQGQIA